MRIGVISFFNNGNFGSELQAYALHEKLRQLGHEPCYIKVKETNIFLKYIYFFLSYVNFFFDGIFHPTLFYYYWKLTKSNLKKKVITEESRNKIQYFVDKNINKIQVSRFRVKKTLNEYFDIFICGSDQIWSPLKMPFDPYRFLCFAHNDRKISYAASFGVNKMPSFHTHKIMRYIKKFKYISVREDNAAKIIKEKTGMEVSIVLDPTLLIESAFWKEKVRDISIPPNLSNGYILCYFLSEPSDKAIETIKNICLNENQKIVVLPYENQICNISGSMRIECDPLEFVKLIQGARIVLTDSFHGTIFSIIMNIPFLSFYRTQIKQVAQTSRLSSILNLLNLESRFIDNTSDLNNYFEIDYRYANQILEKQRVYSENFLISALENINGRECND